MSPHENVPVSPPETENNQELCGTDPPARPTEGLVLPRWLTFATLGVLLLFIAIKGTTLCREWFALRKELRKASDTVVVGYLDVAVNPSNAARPKEWYREEGDHAFLWSGWVHNVGHGWFRVGRGEVDRAKLSYPLGRDVLRAIDYPLVEIAGGAIWSRVPSTAQVFGVELGEVATVYPLRVLDKVEVVNDDVRGRALLVAFSPFTRVEQSVCVYDPVLEGRRLSMGVSGYCHESKPLLYDRGTESLWMDTERGLAAIAGPLRGSVLPQLARPSLMTWGDWLSRHPNSRLLVGADRSKPRPEL